MEAQKKFRNNFKLLYTDSLNHDLTYFEECVAGSKFIVWWHGDRYSKQQMRRFVKECKEELTKIEVDKTYKPWKS